MQRNKNFFVNDITEKMNLTLSARNFKLHNKSFMSCFTSFKP